MGLLDFLMKKHRLEEHTHTEVDFLSEKNGASEQKLKDALFGLLLSDPSIEEAYLVSVQYDRQETMHIALCLRGRLGQGAGH